MIEKAIEREEKLWSRLEKIEEQLKQKEIFDYEKNEAKLIAAKEEQASKRSQ